MCVNVCAAKCSTAGKIRLVQVKAAMQARWCILFLCSAEEKPATSAGSGVVLLGKVLREYELEDDQPYMYQLNSEPLAWISPGFFFQAKAKQMTGAEPMRAISLRRRQRFR